MHVLNKNGPFFFFLRAKQKFVPLSHGERPVCSNIKLECTCSSYEEELFLLWLAKTTYVKNGRTSYKAPRKLLVIDIKKKKNQQKVDTPAQSAAKQASCVGGCTGQIWVCPSVPVLSVLPRLFFFIKGYFLALVEILDVSSLMWWCSATVVLIPCSQMFHTWLLLFLSLHV